MACPLMNDELVDTSGHVEQPEYQYKRYLQLTKLLNCQDLHSVRAGYPIHDEHLFVITHQTYELWFKQILFELDSICEIFKEKIVDERKTMITISRMHRIVVILKLLVDQFGIIETMTPQDFLDFRPYIDNGSGFQSLQFRLLENKFGLLQENRIEYNKENYKDVFTKVDSDMIQLRDSLTNPSLLDLIVKWLERTPGLDPKEFNFWKRFKGAVNKFLLEHYKKPAEEETDELKKHTLLKVYEKQREIFENIIDSEKYELSKSRRERRFSHQAFQGALMVLLYRDEPRFHQPFQILNQLMEIDSQMTKWRYNHVVMVQKMIGSKIGTGGSSGYQYLRTTVSDRYKVFIDLFNIATYLIPRQYIPELPVKMQRCLYIAHPDKVKDMEREIEMGNGKEDTDEEVEA